MNKVEIDIHVASLEEAQKFYCEELGLFGFYEDNGMGQISLAYKGNKSILLLLSEKIVEVVNKPVFRLEVEDCESFFNRVKSVQFATGGELLSKEIFEYPLGKVLSLKDPSGNRFDIFEDYRSANT